jgi:hypothetical protein
MSKIQRGLAVEKLAAIISEALSKADITAVLSGGSVVSIYSVNEYESADLDFVTDESIHEIAVVMESLGYRRTSRHFEHKESEFLVEFPPTPLMVGHLHLKTWGRVKTDVGVIQILTPTQCVMDRLAAFYHWSDRQCLDQAVMVARRHRVDLDAIGEWSKGEGAEARHREFRGALKKAKRDRRK